MKNKAVEPSEIIIGKGHEYSHPVKTASPMIRFLARFIDYSLWILCLWALRVLLGGHFPLSLFEYLIPFEFFIWIPVEASFMSLLGTTPGKFFLRVKLHQGRKARLDFLTALRRSFNVWLRGLGMGIPILNIFCLGLAAHRLKILKTTSWDREENITVTELSIQRWRIWVSFFFIISSFFFYYQSKNEQLKATEYGK